MNKQSFGVNWRYSNRIVCKHWFFCHGKFANCRRAKL